MNTTTNSTIPSTSEVNEFIKARTIILAIALSDAIYLIYLYKSLRKWLITKDWKFLFPMVAALFAFSNNINDIFTFINYPNQKEHKSSDYCEMYLNVFKITALFNWTPISWIQTLRLIHFAKYFYTKTWYHITFVITITLSIIYSLFYYLNLYHFNVTEHSFLGCSVTHQYGDKVVGDYVKEIMIFDVLDSSFALGTLVFSAYNALDNLRELKFRHVKLKRMTDEGMVQLIVLTVSKILFYPLIFLNSSNAFGDICWDFLSVIVIICSFRMINIRHQKNDKIVNNYRRRMK